MNVELDIAQPLLVMLSLLVLVALSLGATARPWRSGLPGLRDRLRIGSAVVRYDFWLELYGVRRRRRRNLREELRANLDAAAERVGTAQAVAALGSLRRMSAEAATGPGTGPRWSTGGTAAVCAFIAVMVAELFVSLGWVSAADASGAARVEGSLPLFPGSTATWESTTDSFFIGLQPGWLMIAAAFAAFVLGSRPWLAVSRRHRGASV